MEYELHYSLKQQINAFLQENAWITKTELQLPSCKIPDIIALGPGDKIIIVEIKTALRDRDVSQAWDKYSAWCDGLYVGATHEDIDRIHRPQQILDWHPMTSNVGYIGASRGVVTVYRQPVVSLCKPEVRHWITQNFGRRISDW